MSAGSAGVQTPEGATPLTKKDFVSDQEVRWCPGCGDYSILSSVQKLLPSLDIPRENYVFVSGIGCSSRFPYYMNTYGFHTIHGRAPTLATGIKLSNPELSVWVVTGDGDGLSIGGNHLLHAIRRNLDMKILLFNNRIYGLTKGQYSPTSEQGKRTPSTPLGSIDYPLNPLRFALAAEATFVARSYDTDPKHLGAVLERAAHHKGTAFIEIYQNCNIFNNGAFADVYDRKVRQDRVLYLEHGKPMVFGENRTKGVYLKEYSPAIVDINGSTESDLLVHDEQHPQQTLAYLLTQMDYPEYPVPMGVFRDIERSTYDDLLADQIKQDIESKGAGDISTLLNQGDTWVVE